MLNQGVVVTDFNTDVEENLRQGYPAFFAKVVYRWNNETYVK